MGNPTEAIMSKQYICAAEDEIIFVTGDDDIHGDGYDFSDGSKIEAFDHQEAAQEYSRKIDRDNEIDFDGRDIYVKCLETGTIKKFHVSVDVDPSYHATESEV